MNLKEACRYANHLESQISSLSSYIRIENNIVKVSENHQKSKSNSDAQDETTTVTTERLYNCKVEDITYLIKQLIEEKLKLSLSIENAKKSIKLDWVEDGQNLTLDSAIEFNKQLHTFTGNLRTLVDLKSTEFKKTGSDFKFNVNGDQVSYRYNIDVKKEIDFDRNIVKDLYKKLVSKADIISTQIDEAMLKDSIRYEVVYDLHDSTAEIVEKFVASKREG